VGDDATWPALLDADPLHWGAILAAMDLPEELPIFLREGDLRSLSPDVLQDLRKADDFLRAQELPRLFAPLLAVRPADPREVSLEEVRPGRPPGALEIPGPASIGPWLAATQLARREFQALHAEGDRITAAEDWRGPLAEEMRELQRVVRMGVNFQGGAHMDLAELTKIGSPVRQHRTLLARWLDPYGEALRRLFLVASRSIEREPETAEVAARLVQEALIGASATFYGHWGFAPPRWVFGGPGRTGAAALIEVEFLHRAGEVQRRLARRQAWWRDAFLDALERAARPGPPGSVAAQARVLHAWLRRKDLAVAEGDAETALRLFTDHRARFRDAGPRYLLALAMGIAGTHREEAETDRLPEALRQALIEDLTHGIAGAPPELRRNKVVAAQDFLERLRSPTP
jgi:hypothetical protein